MGHADYLRLGGDYNAICDRCGSKFKFSQLKLEWDGLYVCTANGCFENRQPQDYVKGVRDNMAVPVSRPDQPSVFLDTLWATPSISASLLSFAINRLKSLAVSVSSAVNLVTSTILRGFGTKVVNGSAINSKTLG
jgi:hypothetical protein